MEQPPSHTRFHIIPRELIIRHLLFNPFSDLEELHIPIHRIFMRYMTEREDEEFKEEQSHNPNFMQEKNMNYRLYPFYINWKKIEHNEQGYYRVFVRYGYLGAAIFSNFKDKYPSLEVNNFFPVLTEFIIDNLLKIKVNNNLENNEVNNKNEETEEKIKEFFEKFPNINDLFDLIEKKIIMMKEVPLLILVLKFYELNFMVNKNNEDIINVLKYEYLLLSYLSDDEYKNIYNNHFKGKICKIFKKFADIKGKSYLLSKNKVKYINHIKSVYKNNSNNNSNN